MLKQKKLFDKIIDVEIVATPDPEEIKSFKKYFMTAAGMVCEEVIIKRSKIK